MKKILFTLIVVSTIGLIGELNRESPIITTVVDIYDGDTFYINIENIHPVIGYRLPVRVARIDCPEINSKEKNVKDKAIEAKRIATKKLLGKKVKLYKIKRDKYFRLRSEVEILETRENFSDFMLDKKLAAPYNGEAK